MNSYGFAIVIAWLLGAAIGLGILYLIIKGAVLGALRQHARESAPIATTTARPAHTDADGL